MRVLGLALAVVLSSFAFTAGAVEFHRIVYDDDSTLKLDRPLVEEAFGASLVELPSKGNPPRRPKSVRGVILYTDPEFDPQWVVGDRSPMGEYEKVKAAIEHSLKLKDIDEKCDEYRFLKAVAPEIAPP